MPSSIPSSTNPDSGKIEKGRGIRETYRRLLPYLKRYRRQAALTVVLGAVAALGSKANLVLLKPLVSRLIPGESGAAPISTLDRFDAWLDEILAGVSFFGLEGVAATVAILCLALLVSAAIFAFVQYGFLRLSRMLGVRIVTDLRQDLAIHVLKLDMRFHSRRRLGDLMSRTTSDVGTSLRLLTLVVEELVQEPFNVAAAFAVAFMAAPTATIGMLVVLPLFALPVIKLGPKVRRRSAQSQARLGDATQAMLQMFAGIREVKAFRMESHEVNEFSRANQEFVRHTDRMVRTQALSQAMTNFFVHGGVGLLLGGIALINLFVPLFSDAGSMMAFFAATAVMFSSVKRLTKAVSIIYGSLGATDRVLEVFDMKPAIQDKPQAQGISGLSTGIRFRNLGFAYEAADGLALDGIDFEIPRGQRIALVGSSGAGKSTMLDLVARFYDPSSGSIEVDGIDLRDLRHADWMDRLALVSQRAFLFQTSLRENVRYGRPGASDDEVEAACQAAGLKGFVAQLPAGLDTQVGESGTRLSGGQAQRVTIARAVLKNADLLLLDEATSALDSESERHVQKALDQLMVGRTVLVIAHRLSTVKSADRILVLSRGKIVESGKHEDLVAAEGPYARFWALQSRD